MDELYQESHRQIQFYAAVEKIYRLADTQYASGLDNLQKEIARIVDDANKLSSTDAGRVIDSFDTLTSGELQHLFEAIGRAHDIDQIVAFALFGGVVDQLYHRETRESLIGKAIDWLEGVRKDGERLREALTKPQREAEEPTGPGMDPKRFSIALSFPGERRPFVDKVASHLAAQVGRERVLYDKYHEAEFAQPDLDVYLPNLYRTESELIAIFLCADYEKKQWCKLEWRFIRQLISTSESRRIMLISFDDLSPIPEIGILPGDGYVSVGSRTPDEIAVLILERLERNRGPSTGPSTINS
jgi:hypothetical protein